MRNINQTDDSNENEFINLMHGTYSDILFILLPYLAILMHRFWQGEAEDILLKPDISIIAATLAGLSVNKFVLGLINGQTLKQYKERIVFFIAITIFAVLLPSIILSIKLTSNEDVPEFVAFVQPLLLIVAITLYSGAVSVSKILGKTSSMNTAPVSHSSPDSALMSLDNSSAVDKET